MSIYKRIFASVFLSFFFYDIANSDEGIVELDPYQVHASHRFEGLLDSSTSRNWDSKRMEIMAPSGVDEVLRFDPSFSFYRRQSSRFANPTTQGVSLRNIGSSAAGRSLVLLDGIPQHDPFGGWVYWARYRPSNLSGVSILGSSQVASWGHLSAGGIISMESVSGERPFFVELDMGSFDSLSGLLGGSVSVGEHMVHTSYGYMESSGDFVVHPDDRGSIDGTATLRSEDINLKFQFGTHPDRGAELSFSSYLEERSNGTNFALNAIDAWDLSGRWFLNHGDALWTGVLYLQVRDFENTFTSVNSTRDSETPVNHQFDVPSQSIGASFTRFQSNFQGWDVQIGVDVRHLIGEVNEDYGWGLKNRRVAGGEQFMFGGFFGAEKELLSNQSIHLNLRMDHWSLAGAFRQDRVRSTGVFLTDQTYDDRSGYKPSFSIRYENQIANGISVGSALSKTFRLPTINELYRPFRVRNDITEANSNLEVEGFLNAEAFLQWNLTDRVSIQTGIHHYWIDDSVANVYQFDGPATSVGGFVPDGGTFSKKENVPRASVLGWNSLVVLRPSKGIEFRINHLFTRAKFERKGNPLGIAGKQFPQIPEHKAVFEGIFNLNSSLHLNVSATISSSQFDDSLNRRTLRSYHRADFALVYSTKDRGTWSFYMRNLTDQIILTGVSSNGLRSIAPSRSVGLKWSREF